MRCPSFGLSPVVSVSKAISMWFGNTTENARRRQFVAHSRQWRLKVPHFTPQKSP
ncbi:MAG: hypothetical protein F6K62_10480 [Sphaerospermopsis sp. SIO1G2]|nr:hypothetical protein [Sphaerospermopsis sp. SIO1G2]